MTTAPKVIYTTNAIESLNASLRKITKNRRIFPTDDSVLITALRQMDHANQRLETGYEPIHVDVWRPDLQLNSEAIYTKKFTDPLFSPELATITFALRERTMIKSVQYLRAIAALMVVMHHVVIKGRQYDIPSLSWFHIGYYGVDLFFIISAYIMCITTEQREVTFGRFISARCTRILPLYWLMTVFALAIFIVKPSVVNSSGGTTSVIASFFLLPDGTRFLVNNGWTLSYEFLFYFIFGFGLFLSRHHKKTIIVAIILALAALGLSLHPSSPYLKFITNIILVKFALGILAFDILRRKPLSAPVALVMLAAGVGMLVWENFNGSINTPLSRTLYAGLPMLLVFLGLVSFEQLIQQFRSRLLNLLETIGDASYSLYLVHGFILSPCAMIAHKLHLTRYPLLFCLFLLLSAVISGWLCYRYIELPLNKRIKITLAARKANAVSS